MNINSPLRAARRSRGLTQTEAARLVGIDQGQWSRIERGKQQPGIDVLFQIVDAFGLTEADVLAPFRKRTRLEPEPAQAAA